MRVLSMRMLRESYWAYVSRSYSHTEWHSTIRSSSVVSRTLTIVTRSAP